MQVLLRRTMHAKARGAKIYVELAGTGASGDAYHLTASHPEGLGAKLVMQSALEDAGMKPESFKESLALFSFSAESFDLKENVVA